MTLMEVCGTHTVNLRKSGIHAMLPENVRLISGPGCPVCVTPTSYIDSCFSLIEKHDAVIATFGDMVKVPGTDGRSLSFYMGTESVKLVYSPAEVIALAEKTDKPVVFLGIGFETTIPVVASVFFKIKENGPKNIFLYPVFKTVPPALKALLADPDRYFDGFILPGHVSVIIGEKAYRFLEEPDGAPGVITGFEPVDMLCGVERLLRVIASGENRVENRYTRAVRADGNGKAREIMNTMLQPVDALWRGLGTIPASGLGLRPEYSDIDAVSVFDLPQLTPYDPPGCRCAEVIQGKMTPPECGLFGKECVPEVPVGPCMVSSEGSCAAYLRYGEVENVR
jgi:hydrogenase expression/formation protein HypD